MEDAPIHGINSHLPLKSRVIKSSDYYCKGIVDGNRFVLAEAITLIESTQEEKQKVSAEIADFCFRQAQEKSTIRIAITGPPGAGKSTFIDAFGMYLLNRGHRLAVLAIDPSSHMTSGSILGDKSRMEQLSVQDNAYVRPTSAGNLLGGISHATKETIPLCEAAGYDIVIVETVGVGQSEYLASSICDMTILLVQPGAGDDLQGIKKGIVEMADIFIVTKADGPQKEIALCSKQHMKEALHFGNQRLQGYNPPVLTTSAFEKFGFEEVYNAIQTYIKKINENIGILSKRREQELQWLEFSLKENAFQFLIKNKQIARTIEEQKTFIHEGKLSCFSALIRIQEIITKILSQ